LAFPKFVTLVMRLWTSFLNPSSPAVTLVTSSSCEGRLMIVRTRMPVTVGSFFHQSPATLHFCHCVYGKRHCFIVDCFCYTSSIGVAIVGGLDWWKENEVEKENILEDALYLSWNPGDVRYLSKKVSFELLLAIVFLLYSGTLVAQHVLNERIDVQNRSKFLDAILCAAAYGWHIYMYWNQQNQSVHTSVRELAHLTITSPEQENHLEIC